MDTKLTLKLDQEIIEKAKRYAANKKLSLSRLIENYLNSLTMGKALDNDTEVSPFVKSLSSKIDIPVDYDYKNERADYFDKKYS